MALPCSTPTPADRRLLVISPQRAVAAELKARLEAGGACVLTADSAQQLPDAARGQLDATVMHVARRATGPAEELARIAERAPVVLAVERPALLNAVPLAGLARGLVFLDGPRARIPALVELACHGLCALPAGLDLPRAIDRARLERLTQLSGTERAVLAALAAGASDREIARRLGLGEGHTKYLVRRILQKLRFANRTRAAVFAADHAAAL
jgi:DNA-binding NarL/FixJ family response regulator